MRKLLYLFLILVSISYNSICQTSNFDYDVEWSEKNNSKDHSVVFDVEPIGFFDNVGYSFSPKSHNPMLGYIYLGQRIGSINKLSSDLKTIKTQILNLESDGMKRDFEFVLKLKDELIVFSSYKDTKTKKNILYSQLIDKNSFKFIGNLEKVVEIDFSNYNRFKKSMYSYSFSQDSSKVALRYDLVNDKGEILSFGLAVLNSENDIAFKTENINLLDKGFLEIDDCAVSNIGEVAILGKYFETSKEKDKSIEFESPFYNPYTTKVKMQANYDYKIKTFSSKGEQNEEINLKLQGKQLIYLKPLFDNSGSLFVQGLCGGTQSMAVLGNCIFKIGLNENKIIKSDYNPFSEELLTRHLSSGDAKKLIKDISKDKEYEKGYYSLKRLIPDETGGFWSIAENFNAVQKTSEMMSWIEFSFKHLFISKYDKNGNHVMTTKVDKNQVFIFDSRYAGMLPFESFNYHANKGNLYIVHPEIDNSKMSYKLKTINIHKVDGSGKIMNSDFSVVDDFNYPNLAGKFSKNSLLFYGYKNRNITYLKLDFK